MEAKSPFADFPLVNSVTVIYPDGVRVTHDKENGMTGTMIGPSEFMVQMGDKAIVYRGLPIIMEVKKDSLQKAKFVLPNNK